VDFFSRSCSSKATWNDLGRVLNSGQPGFQFFVFLAQASESKSDFRESKKIIMRGTLGAHHLSESLQSVVKFLLS
jgi:hypothetical protein